MSGMASPTVIRPLPPPPTVEHTDWKICYQVEVLDNNARKDKETQRRTPTQESVPDHGHITLGL